jgi:hypothetical protein
VLIDGVDRTDVPGLGTQPFLLWAVRLFVDIIHTAFMIGVKIARGNGRTDTTTNAALVDMISG